MLKRPEEYNVGILCSSHCREYVAAFSLLSGKKEVTLLGPHSQTHTLLPMLSARWTHLESCSQHELFVPGSLQASSQRWSVKFISQWRRNTTDVQLLALLDRARLADIPPYSQRSPIPCYGSGSYSNTFSTDKALQIRYVYIHALLCIPVSTAKPHTHRHTHTLERERHTERERERERERGERTFIYRFVM